MTERKKRLRQYFNHLTGVQNPTEKLENQVEGLENTELE